MIKRNIVFHHNDADGRCAAAIALSVLANEQKEVIFHEMDYVKEPDFSDITAIDTVYVLDYSFKPDKFARLAEATSDIVWIDHHKTAIKACKDAGLKFRGIRSKTCPSGAMLTWQYFRDVSLFPVTVEYINKWDTWTHNNDETILNFVAGLDLWDTTPASDLWVSILNPKSDVGQATVDSIIKQGAIVNDYKNHRSKELMEQIGFNVEFEGLKGYAANIPRTSSFAFKSMEGKDYDVWMPFFYTGEKFIVSLYAAKGSIPDLGKIAQKYGDGGHPKAAGFVCDKLPF